MMKVAQQAVVLAFVALLFAPMAAISLSPNFNDELLSQLLNPASRQQAVESLRRSTPLWNDAVSAYNTALYYLKTSNNPSIGVIGENGWVFLGDNFDKSFSQNIRRFVISDQDRDYWTASLGAQVRYLSRRNIPMLFIVAPSTGTIYSDKLPAWTRPLLHGPTSFDRVLEADKSLPILDVRPQLKEARARADTYSKFNSHWNDFGAWVAWQSIAAELGRKLPGFQGFGVGHLANVATLDDNASEFRNMLGIDVRNRWNTYVLDEPFPDYFVVNPDGSRVRKPGYAGTDLLEMPRETYSPNATSGLTALVVRDSMGNSLSPFFQASFQHVFQVNHHHASRPSEEVNLIPLVRRIKPDVVIYVMTERYFDFPLGNAFYWLSVDRFEQLPAQGELVWSPESAFRSAFSASVDPRLDSPATINLAGIGSAPSGRALLVKGTGDGWGYLTLTYKMNGQSYALNEGYYAGPNELYFELPQKVDDDALTLTKGPEAGPALRIQSLAIRQ